jgi:hypothetical protein
MATFQFPYPFFPIQFTKDGVVFQRSDVDALIAALANNQNGVTDLFLMSHGWNNNMDEAKQLYSGLAQQLSAQIQSSQALRGRSFAICGALWPSKKFDDKDLIPGGAAALNDAVTDQVLQDRINNLRDLFQAKGWPMSQDLDPDAERSLAQVQEAIGTWEDDPEVRRTTVEAVRRLVPDDSADAEDASDKFMKMKADNLVTNLSRSLNPPPNIPAGANASAIDPFFTAGGSGIGGAASFRDVLGGVKAAFLHLLNYTTYYLMKARAGYVGTKGIEPTIEEIRATRPDIRIHLMGHSFGCRVMAAAVNALPVGQTLRPNTMTLLQGAFSHNGFASRFDGHNDGAFREIVQRTKVRGPILITHTRNDKAVGIAYPIASRIAGQVASALGDENDLYGGLGSNGAQTAQTTPERVVGNLLDVGGNYAFGAGSSSSRPYNLRADKFIADHSDIIHPEIGYATVVAMSTPDAD